MSDTTETETETETNTDTTDEPSKAELHERVEQLESTVAKMMPSRRDLLRMGAAGLAGAAGLSAATQPADASTGSAGDIGDPSNRPDIFADEIDANQLTGISTGGDRQGCRVFLSSAQSIASSSFTKIQFDSEVYDSGNNFDVSSHNWTCPKDGLYLAHLAVRLNQGGNDQNRTVAIGSGSSRSPGSKGAFINAQSSDSGDRLQATTVNKYAQGDTIAGYAQNGASGDQLQADSKNFDTHMEIAFLGGL